MNRRFFIQSMLNVGAASTVSQFFPLAALAQAKAQGNLLIIKMDGGWDTSLASDPWIADQRPLETDYFLEYRKEELVPFGSSFVGPALKPLESYFNRMAIVNGIFLSANDIGHDGAGIYMESGNGQGDLPSLATEVDTQFFHSAFGTATNSRVNTAAENRMIFDLSTIQTTKMIKSVDSLIQYQNANTDLIAGILSLNSNQKQIDVMNAHFAKIKESLTDADLVTGTFLSGLSRTMVMHPRTEKFSFLDTHSQHENNHKNSLTSLMEATANILNGLQSTESLLRPGASLLDETTVLIYSEFARTPGLNANRGKDHNPQSNSALLFGPGIKAGKVGAAKSIGRAVSNRGVPYLVGQPLRQDETVAENRNEGAFLIRPETVLATLVESMGLDRSRLGREISKAPLLKTLLK